MLLCLVLVSLVVVPVSRVVAPVSLVVPVSFKSLPPYESISP